MVIVMLLSIKQSLRFAESRFVTERLLDNENGTLNIQVFLLYDGNKGA